MKIATDDAHESEKIELNMTSMIDCVFLLLIFFIMTLNFPEVEANLPANLPKQGIRKTGEPPPPPPPKPEELLVVLKYPKKQLSIVIGSRDLGSDLRLLQRTLGLFRSKFTDARVTIDSGPDVPYQYVVSALNSCARLGIVKVRFAQPRDNT